MRLDLRGAGRRFSKAVKAVMAGEEVVLTERGKSVAVMKPLPKLSKGERQIRRLEAAGLLRAASKRVPLPPWPPRRLKGVPLSKTVREERDEGHSITRRRHRRSGCRHGGA